jgi:glycosyltransferase involved in cell wall biosynthesis
MLASRSWETNSVPRFSIVVPAYNAEATLPETLDAVLAQEFDDWECVVVDDGSGDATLAVARGYAAKDPRVRALCQSNQGTAGAYNTGVSTATGDFVVLCSADDILLPDLLSELSRFVDADSGCDIVSTNGYFLKPDGTTELVYAPDRTGSYSTWPTSSAGASTASEPRTEGDSSTSPEATASAYSARTTTSGFARRLGEPGAATCRWRCPCTG